MQTEARSLVELRIAAVAAECAIAAVGRTGHVVGPRAADTGAVRHAKDEFAAVGECCSLSDLKGEMEETAAEEVQTSEEGRHQEEGAKVGHPEMAVVRRGQVDVRQMRDAVAVVAETAVEAVGHRRFGEDRRTGRERVGHC